MKKLKIPHTYTIVFFLILCAAALTWIIPGGEFVRHMVDVNGKQREVVVSGSFHYVDNTPQTWQVFSAFFKGFVDRADIVVFILMVGGAFWILNSTKAIDVGVMTFLRKVTKLQRFRFFKKIGVNNIIIVLVMLMFSVFGAVFGMSEETIAFVVIFIPLAISMGYDSIVGVCMCYMAAHIGFAGAIINPFTIGIAQGIAELPMFSGMEYRIVCWFVLTIIGIAFVLWYAARVKRNPQRSIVYDLDSYWRNRAEEQEKGAVSYHTPKSAWVIWVFLTAVMTYFAVAYPFTTISIGEDSSIAKANVSLCILPVLAGLFFVTGFFALRKSVHFFILNLLFFTIFYLVTGVLGYDWGVMEISALFLAMGIFSGIANGEGADRIAKLFLEGAKDIMSAALIVGLASGIIFILKDGKIIDTILYGMSKSLSSMGEMASVGVMYLFQTLLNLVMPSGSAKAALTMPVMAQFADLIGVSRQTTVLAFQFGDGFTNMITPTSGVLIGCLGVARIPWEKWVRFIWKFILVLIALGALLLIPTVTMNLAGF